MHVQITAAQGENLVEVTFRKFLVVRNSQKSQKIPATAAPIPNTKHPMAMATIRTMALVGTGTSGAAFMSACTSFVRMRISPRTALMSAQMKVAFIQNSVRLPNLVLSCIRFSFLCH